MNEGSEDPSAHARIKNQLVEGFKALHQKLYSESQEGDCRAMQSSRTRSLLSAMQIEYVVHGFGFGLCLYVCVSVWVWV